MKLTTMVILAGAGWLAYQAYKKRGGALGENPYAAAPQWQSCIRQRNCIGRRAQTAYAEVLAEYNRVRTLPLAEPLCPRNAPDLQACMGRRIVTDPHTGRAISLDDIEQILAILAQRVHGIKADGSKFWGEVI